MRVKIKGKNGLPEIYEVVEVKAFVEDEQYTGNGKKAFCIFLHYARNIPHKDPMKVSVPLSAFDNDEDSMTEERARQEYVSIVASLGVSGYANLCYGEQTCLIDKKWTVQP